MWNQSKFINKKRHLRSFCIIIVNSEWILSPTSIFELPINNSNAYLFNVKYKWIAIEKQKTFR